jgi:hypothetical protein
MGTLAARRPSAAATAGSRSGTALLDRQLIRLEFLAIHLLYGRLGLFLTRHLDEAEASGLAGGAVPYDPDRRDVTESREGLSQIVLARICGKVSNIDVHPAFPLQRSERSRSIPVHTGSLRSAS